METGLDSIRAGARAVVMQVQAKKIIAKRFYDIGLAPGAVVYCRYRSPGGKVVILEFRETVVALRTRDLRKIRIACSGV